MKLTADRFLRLLENRGIEYAIQSGHLMLMGTETNLITRLNNLLDTNAEFEAGITQYINRSHCMTLKEFQLALEGAGIRAELSDLHTLKLHGGKDKTRNRLMDILERNSLLKAAVSLSLAVKNSELLDAIQERACIRWESGYSDSLLMAVLSGIALTGETIQRDNDGEIVLRPKTDWNAELSSL